MPLLDDEQIEIELILAAIHLKYGYDFKGYSRAHFTRRVKHFANQRNLSQFTDIIFRLTREREFFDQLLADLTINVTEMFRDPEFFKYLRSDIPRLLGDKPYIRMWQAGCSTGEEAYSLAICLLEAGLYDNCQIYATDINDKVIEKAKNGIYNLDEIKLYTSNYQKSGGTASFSDYYTARYQAVMINKKLKKNIFFTKHNLVSDESFNEMDLIICRNVLIYFNRDLQNRVLKLFYDSLPPKGVLCLGIKESIAFTDYKDLFDVVSDKFKVYQKK